MGQPGGPGCSGEVRCIAAFPTHENDAMPKGATHIMTEIPANSSLDEAPNSFIGIRSLMNEAFNRVIQMADSILHIDRPLTDCDSSGASSPNVAEVLIAKHRMCAPTVEKLCFIPSYMRFIDCIDA